MQYGKDLSGVEHVIGTGGIFLHSPRADAILRATTFDPGAPLSLRPKKPGFYTDARYCLFAAGLLAERFPEKAFRIAKKYLKKWG